MSKRPEDTSVANYSPIFPALLFLVLVLVANRDLFTVPIIEDGDFAIYAIQIQDAKVLHELLGNNSRWHFHHPGPAFFYLFGAGEYVFHDWLHLVPAALNAHILTVILLNTAFLFTAIAIFARHCRSRLFLPVAVLLALIFTYVVNRTIPGSALVSVWMPYVFLFCFLLFVTTCASVAIGELRDLPTMTLCALLLMHGHVAQSMFVGALAIAACGTMFWRIWRMRIHGASRDVQRNNRSILVRVIALILLFALPPTLDILLHQPNNIDAIRRYMAEHRGMENSLITSVKYASTFFAFVPDPEVILQSRSAHILRRGISKPYVVCYWALFLCLCGLAATLKVKRCAEVPFFLVYMAFEVTLTSILFIYWGMKMAGGMYNFNGHFYFSIQLLALWSLAAFILNEFPFQTSVRSARAAACAAALIVFPARQYFQNVYHGDPNLKQMMAVVLKRPEPLHIVFDAKYWPTAVGLASRMKRASRSFCIDEEWAFLFGRDVICMNSAAWERLRVDDANTPCGGSCQMLFRDSQMQLELHPSPE
jgi:hypothetical protein